VAQDLDAGKLSLGDFTAWTPASVGIRAVQGFMLGMTADVWARAGRRADAAGETPAQGVDVSAPPRRLTTDESIGETRPAAAAEAGAASAANGRRFPRWAWAGALAAVAVALFLLYLRLADTYPAGPDGADQTLQAWDMLHGNWLLRGWTVGDVSYYTTEIPEYVLIEVFRGLGTSVMHIAGALTYTMLVLLAGFLAKGRATGREGVVRALVAAGIMLAPQLGNGIHLLLSQPDHLGTQVPLLVMFIVLDRAPRRWYVPVAVLVMLTWVVVGDQVAVFDAAVPLAAVCGIRVLWALIRDRKPPTAQSLAAQWFELSLAAASLASLAAAAVIVRAIKRAGGYTVLPLTTARSPLQLIPHHLVLTMEGILNVYGADFLGISNLPGNVAVVASGGLPPWGAAALAIVHLAGVALALWGVCRAFRRFFSATDLIAPVLAAAIVINIAVYVVSIRPVNVFDTREVLAVLPFGAVLAGRLLAGSLIRARMEPALAVVLACYAFALGYGASRPAMSNSEQPVISWLEAHGLHTGLGTYTEANAITIDSDGRVAVRTASWRPTGAVPRAYESEASWYDPRVSYANFIISNAADLVGPSEVSVVPYADILAFAGPPAHTYHYESFTIMVWNKNLLADLGRPPSVLPGNIP
jgi:hypothetical protein